MYLNKKKFIVYWLVTLRCSLVNSLYISNFAEWFIFLGVLRKLYLFFPSVQMLLEAEGGDKQGHYHSLGKWL